MLLFTNGKADKDNFVGYENGVLITHSRSPCIKLFFSIIEKLYYCRH